MRRQTEERSTTGGPSLPWISHLVRPLGGRERESLRGPDVGEDTIVGDTADTASPDGAGIILAASAILVVDVPAALGRLVAVKADVALLSPTGVPGVADDPVVHSEAEIVTGTDELDGVIHGDVLGVVATVENSTLVVGPGAGIDGDGEGAGKGQGVDEVVGVVALHVGEVASGQVDHLGAGVVAAAVRVAEVRFVTVGPLLSNTTSGVDVVESELSDVATAAASTATLVRIRGAAGNLLLGQHKELTVADGIVSFNRLCRSMRPARPTVPLILHGGKYWRINLAPVNGVGYWTIGLVVLLTTGVDALKGDILAKSGTLSFGPIAHVVDSLLVRVSWNCVVCAHFLQLLLEEFLTHLQLTATVRLLEVLQVAVEGVALKLVPLGAVSRSGQSEKDDDARDEENARHFRTFFQKTKTSEE